MNTAINGRKLFLITYKASPKSRKVSTSIQWHADAESAAKLDLIRDYSRNAVCVSVRELNEVESKLVTGGHSL